MTELLLRISRLADHFNIRLGQTVAWVAVFMVLIQFAVVIMRYVYGVGSIAVQESLIYMHSVLFMLTVGFAMAMGRHVRIDIIYRNKTRRYQTVIDLLGSVFFLLPFCVVILYFSAPYVSESWRILEGSREVSGIQGVFLLKSLIPAFAGLLLVQVLSTVCRATAIIAQSLGRRLVRNEQRVQE
ncbi:MAG: TRAP transporter small permease subunit [Parvularculales bacterium]